ncbi:phosphatidylinositol alpha-1,6-mannosyltransferase [Pedobacter agri]|nr:phosphatidylinositol alpha-1,6-mannosyltransferase [Pedobacter agri]
MRNPKVLFLTLYTFSLTGGIEKVCRNFLQVLDVLQTKQKLGNYRSLSLHDKITKQNHKGYEGNKISFGLAALKESLNADIIILGHIHLLIFARMIKLIKPQKRIILFAHGIEVWKPLTKWQQSFLNEIDIWAVSRYTAAQLNKVNGISGKNVLILNNCLPLETNHIATSKDTLRQKHHVLTGQQIILTVCRLSSTEKYKGYDLVLLALRDLIKIYPNIRYFIVGAADEPEKKRVLKLVQDCQLEAHVTSTGYVPEAEIEEYYQLADIFAMPSKGEGFGLVFLEAIAMGCQVLAGNSDGSSDALLNGELGLLVDPDDSDAIYPALLQLLEEPASQELIDERQQKVKRHFGFERYVEQVEALLFED